MSIVYQCDECGDTVAYTADKLPTGWTEDSGGHLCEGCSEDAAEEEDNS